MAIADQSFASYPEVLEEVRAAVAYGRSLAADADGLSRQDLRSIVARSAPVLIEILRGYESMKKQQKKAIVDAALAEVLLQLKPYLIDTAAAIIASLLPWYLAWLPWVLSLLIDVDIVGRLSAEIPGISQAVFDGLKSIWSRSSKSE
jgi:hypothetical protein